MSKPDARIHRRCNHGYTIQLIAEAATVTGSINALAVRAGISPRRLRYLIDGWRKTERGVLAVRLSFAEQVTLEAIASESEDQPS